MAAALDEKQRMKVRRLYFEDKMTFPDLAKRFDVSANTIRNVIHDPVPTQIPGTISNQASNTTPNQTHISVKDGETNNVQ